MPSTMKIQDVGNMLPCLKILDVKNMYPCVNVSGYLNNVYPPIKAREFDNIYVSTYFVVDIENFSVLILN